MLEDKKIIIYPGICLATAGAILGWYKEDVITYEKDKPGRDSVIIYTIKMEPEIAYIVYYTKTAIVIRKGHH